MHGFPVGAASAAVLSTWFTQLPQIATVQKNSSFDIRSPNPPRRHLRLDKSENVLWSSLWDSHSCRGALAAVTPSAIIQDHQTLLGRIAGRRTNIANPVDNTRPSRTDQMWNAATRAGTTPQHVLPDCNGCNPDGDSDRPDYGSNVPRTSVARRRDGAGGVGIAREIVPGHRRQESGE